MAWYQRRLALAPRTQGIHLITQDLTTQLPELAALRVGLAHFFLVHTSAGLALNEGVEPEVRADLAAFLHRLTPENALYTHRYEGPDDMPAHIKSVLVGHDLSVPVTDGRLALGTWQGIYLCEFRRSAPGRRVLITLTGDHR
jgi:secondary thiamine-phosphate synthase enzyme